MGGLQGVLWRILLEGDAALGFIGSGIGDASVAADKIVIGAIEPDDKGSIGRV